MGRVFSPLFSMYAVRPGIGRGGAKLEKWFLVSLPALVVLYHWGIDVGVGGIFGGCLTFG